MIERIKRKRVAMISGWAVDPNAVYRYQVDAAFPLSDHADYTDLVRYVDLVQPKRVLTLHGFAAEFARDLRNRGMEAWAISAVNQLEFTLNAMHSTVSLPLKQSAKEVDSEFYEFANIGERIAATPAKLEKIRLLSEYFRSLEPTRLGIAATYFTGQPFAQHDSRVLQTGWSII